MSRTRVVVLGSFLCVALAAAAIVPIWLHERSAARVRDWNRREQAVSRGTETAADDVEALAGEVETAKGARLTVRIARLHERERQQRFDAMALATRFGLSAGEPFVCEIGVRGAGSVAQGALRSIAVEDERGAALVPFPTVAAADNEPTDPLATLLAPPMVELTGGAAVSVILWGRRPGAGARLSGLADVDVALAPTHIGSRELDTALARIDAQNASAPGAPK